MPTLPSIYLIHASDVPQHLGKLTEILQTLKAEQRVTSFVILRPDDPLTRVQDNDLVLIMLTQAIEPDKAALENELKLMRENLWELKIAEIIVDQIPYDNEFITFPSDLKYIRGRDDMDAVWKDIEESLKDMFPVIARDHWKKYLKYVVLALVIIVMALLVWWFTRLGEVKATFTANPMECGEPCEVHFDNKSENAGTYLWDFGDGTTEENESPTHIFEAAGDYLVRLIASSDNRRDTVALTIRINPPPPIANFSYTNVGCMAPCTVVFNNTSKNADTFEWYFGDGEESNERNPSHLYQEPGDYTVSLVAKRGELDSVKTYTLKIIEKSQEPAAFTVSGVVLNVSSNNYSGNCPYTIDFKATITVNGAGTVKYVCLRKDGTTTPVETIQFSEAGSKTIDTPPWTYGGTGNVYKDLWQELRIIDPLEKRSNRAYFNLICKIPCVVVARANTKVYEDPENIHTKSEIINLGVRGTLGDGGTFEVIEKKTRASAPFFKIKDQKTGLEGWVHNVFNDLASVDNGCFEN